MTRRDGEIVIARLISRQPVALENGGLAGFGIEFHRQVTAVFQKLDTGEGGTKPDLKRPPVAGFGKGRADAFGGMAEETNARNAGQQAAFPENETGMKVADDGVLNLGNLRADIFLPPQEWQRSGIVAEQQDSLGGF